VWAAGKKTNRKPWETPGSPEDLAAGSAVSLPPAKIGLWILLAVITSLFGLFHFRLLDAHEHAHGDWTPLAVPRLLWLNTALLILSSAGMQWARGAARRAQADRVRVALIAAGVLALAFLAGQLVAWRQLSASGYFMANSPAIAFFYLLTGCTGCICSVACSFG